MVFWNGFVPNGFPKGLEKGFVPVGKLNCEKTRPATKKHKIALIIYNYDLRFKSTIFKSLYRTGNSEAKFLERCLLRKNYFFDDTKQGTFI